MTHVIVYPHSLPAIPLVPLSVSVFSLLWNRLVLPILHAAEQASAGWPFQCLATTSSVLLMHFVSGNVLKLQFSPSCNFLSPQGSLYSTTEHIFRWN